MKNQKTICIYHITADILKAYESGRILGQTEGAVYGMKVLGAPRWKTLMEVKVQDVGTVIFEGQAATLFRPHPIEGVYSGFKRLTGQYKAPFGDIVFNPLNAVFDEAKRTLTINEAYIGKHTGQSIFNAVFRLWGRRFLEIICVCLWFSNIF